MVRHIVLWLFLGLLTGCRSISMHDEQQNYGAAAWPLDHNTLWLKEETRVALMAKDWPTFLETSRGYASPQSEILQVEYYHATKNIDLEAQKLEDLVRLEVLNVREAMVVLSRHSRDTLVKSWTHPWASVASINRQYFGRAWNDAMMASCMQGNRVACVPLNEAAPQKIVLLLPLSGQLAASAKSFRQGFMTALLHSGNTDISVDTVDTSVYNADALKNILHERKPDWIVGPMGRGEIQAFVKLNLPYPAIVLGECEGSLPADTYCFSLAATGEIPSMIARLNAIGVQNVLVISSGSSWHKNWEKKFMQAARGSASAFALTDQHAWLAAMQSATKYRSNGFAQPYAVDAVVLNMSLADMRQVKELWKTYSLDVRAVMAPSLAGSGMRSLGVTYFDSRLMLAQKDEFLAPNWLGLAAYVPEGLTASQRRFVAWGEDTFSWLSSARSSELQSLKDVPYEGGSGMCYVHQKQVLRSLDVSLPYWNGT